MSTGLSHENWRMVQVQPEGIVLELKVYRQSQEHNVQAKGGLVWRRDTSEIWSR